MQTLCLRAGGFFCRRLAARPRGVGVRSARPLSHRKGHRIAAVMMSAALGRIGAHRGCGENVLWHSRDDTPLPPLYRENTVRSFQAALADGASFLEFDVQVTADGVPVVWHDNYVVYGEHHNPISKLVAELTLAEFKALAPVNQLDDMEELAGGSPAPSEVEGGSIAGDSPPPSLYGTSPPSSTASSRLLRQHRNGVPATPNEPTLRWWDVTQDDQLPTLGEVFAALPLEVPFDIEIKMATPDSLARTPAEEIERMLGAILREVDAAEAAHGPRPLMFSSFDPDVCLELKRRRPGAQVYFLSGGGEYSHADQRRTSVPEALEVAEAGGLQGVILHTAAVARQHAVVDQARARGLALLTYGAANNNPAWVRQQLALGLQGVIVDDVAGVVSALAADIKAGVAPVAADT